MENQQDAKLYNPNAIYEIGDRFTLDEASELKHIGVDNGDRRFAVVQPGSSLGKSNARFSKTLIMAALAAVAHKSKALTSYDPGIYEELPTSSHNRHSKHRVAMDKRAATKARNVKRHKKACR